MTLFAALEVSLKKTAVCVMDRDGALVREAEVPTCPDALAVACCRFGGHLDKVFT
jgi:hypothetical protein